MQYSFLKTGTVTGIVSNTGQIQKQFESERKKFTDSNFYLPCKIFINIRYNHRLLNKKEKKNPIFIANRFINFEDRHKMLSLSMPMLIMRIKNLILVQFFFDF